MPRKNDFPPKRRYLWPWIILIGFLLGVALAVVWMTVEVRRTRQRRDPFAPLPSSGSGHSGRSNCLFIYAR